MSELYSNIHPTLLNIQPHKWINYWFAYFPWRYSTPYAFVYRNIDGSYFIFFCGELLTGDDNSIDYSLGTNHPI